MSCSEETSGLSAQEIADAQFDLDHHPDSSAFWDSSRGQESFGIALDLGLQPKTTREFRNEWHRAEMAAARSGEDE